MGGGEPRQVGETAGRNPFVGPRAVLDDGDRRGGSGAGTQQTIAHGSGFRGAHVDGERVALRGERRPRGFAAAFGAVAGDEGDGRGERRWVSGMPAEAAQPSAAVMPGTTATGRPASRKASTSSPPRPNTNGSPAFSRTTVWPARTRRTSSALMSSCAQLARPLRLPTGDELGVAARARQDRRRHERRRAGWRRPPAGAGRPRRVRRSGSPGPAPTIWAMPTGASRRRAASSSPSAARRAPASSPASDQARRRPLDQPAPEGAAASGLDDQGIDLGAEGRGELRQVAEALGQHRLDAAAQDGRQGRRGAAGRDRHHDIVAIDDRRQDEIAESRPVGHVHRHAEPTWRPAGPPCRGRDRRWR